ncbi:hypothetical protein GQ43DRAFT_455462 [Delitschia confertaspora ATCC 74209]|uniref:Protein SQS1 n=1 Tax=Delitschia confertaspora ATCC 74209 TaxID=1513339 RepID=A0A9P4JPA3_9PLEO|nr:hypothetical protein GQ43DRAFT_455462 [Delitschia confertaspora ATCC 74209]
MPRNKAKKSGKPPPRHQSSAQYSSHYSSNTQAANRHAFSLKDEARFTGGHESNAFSRGSRLRDRGVDFVSAGYLEGTLKDLSQPPPEELLQSQANDLSQSPPDAESPTASAAMADMTIRSPSPTASNSSEEEVVFKGRVIASRPVHVQTQTPATSTALNITPAKPTVRKDVQENFGPNAGGSAPTFVSDTVSEEKSVLPEVFAKRQNGKIPWDVGVTSWASCSKPGNGWPPVSQRGQDMDPSEDPVIRDYMENIRDSVSDGDAATAAPSFAYRDIDLNCANDWVSESSEEIHSQLVEEPDSELSESEDDLDDRATSSDILEEIQCVIGRRDRQSGTQYLIVYENYTRDDARWLPQTSLSTPRDRQLINEYESNKHLRRTFQASNHGADEEAEVSEDDESEDSTDAFMDEDERLARLLAKQEELGLGGDDIVLFEDDEFDYSVNKHGFSKSRSSRNSRKNVHSRGKSSFPSATVMADILEADPYNGFDVMDFERPSLRPTKKGRRGHGPPELSDDELHEHLQSVWEADRSKKRLKKAEREELRKLGLLGRKGKKTPDLSVKYREGYTMVQVVEEIREFMISDSPTCSLPPMDAQKRAAVHQFVSKLGLGSKSRGDGQARFTVLSKTTRTLPYDDDEFDKLAQHKRFRFRFQAAPREGKKTRGPKVRASVGYKDGEAVGAHAPELGPENRGRAMLEKMGWTKGTALGALDNKGILEPIVHTVKTTKAGLQ